MRMQEERTQLYDSGDHYEIDADEIADVYVAGDRAHFVFSKWRKVSGVIRRCFVGEVTRPIVAIEPEMLAKMQATIKIGPWMH